MPPPCATCESARALEEAGMLPRIGKAREDRKDDKLSSDGVQLTVIAASDRGVRRLEGALCTLTSMIMS